MSETGGGRWTASTGPLGALRRSAAKISASSSLSSVSCSSSASDQLVEDVAVLDQDLPRLVVRGLDEPADLLVDHAGDLFGVVALVAHVATEERPRRWLWPSLIAPIRSRHAELRHHRAGPGRWPSRCRWPRPSSGRGRRAPRRPGRPACRRAGRASRCGSWSTCRRRQHHRVAERAAAGQDRDLVHRVGVPQRRRHQGVPALVVRGDLLLLVVHDPGALLRAGDDAVDGLVERLVVDQLARWRGRSAAPPR